MINSFQDIKKKLEEISELLSRVDTDERKEIKKNNKLIDDYLGELGFVRECLMKVLTNKYSEEIKKINYKYNDFKEDIVKYEEMIKNNSLNSYIYKMEFDKNLYEIINSNNLEIIMKNVKDVIDKFLLVGVKLTEEDFNYSISLYKYMVCYFKNINNDDWMVSINQKFDSLYWECPNLVNHIYLAIINLLEKYKDKFLNYLKDKMNTNGSFEEIINKYYDLVIQNEKEKNTCEGIIFDKFKSLELRIDDYLGDNIKDTIALFVDYNKYKEFDQNERYEFFKDSKDMYHNVMESIMLSKYKVLIDKVKDIFKNKDGNKNKFNEFKGKIKRLEKNRIKLNKKLFTINKRIELGKKFGTGNYNNVFNKVNSVIDEIITNYKEYDEVLFINDVVTKITEDSTYYDILNLYLNNYSYFRKLLMDVSEDDLMDEYHDFLMSPYLEIVKNIPFMKEIDIDSKLNEKYMLSDINIDINDKDKLIKDLEFIERVGIYHTIDLDRMKLLIDISKIVVDEDTK